MKIFCMLIKADNGLTESDDSLKQSKPLKFIKLDQRFVFFTDKTCTKQTEMKTHTRWNEGPDVTRNLEEKWDRRHSTHIVMSLQEGG